jgi:hypothetical protein
MRLLLLGILIFGGGCTAAAPSPTSPDAPPVEAPPRTRPTIN